MQAKLPAERETASAGGEFRRGNPSQSFGLLLVRLQEEHWAVCRDRHCLHIENRELKQRLERASAQWPSCGEKVGGTLAAEAVELANVGGANTPCISELEVVAEEGGLLVEEGGLPCMDGLRGAALTSVVGERSRESGLEVDTAGPNSPVSLENRQSQPLSRASSGMLASTQDSKLTDTECADKAAEGGASSLMGCDQLFPDWWNPAPLDKPDFCGMSIMVEGQPTSDCMISPVSRGRLLWDLAAALILLYETWAVPLRLVYLSEDVDLPWMSKVDTAILVFFSLDMLLNFNTGVLERGKVSLVRGRAVRRYLRWRFWFDLVATFPFDFVVGSSSGELASLLRIVRFAKLLKTFRYLRLLKMKRALRSSEDGVKLLSTLRSLYIPFAVLFVLLFLVHIYTCIWSAVRHDLSRAGDYEEAVRNYMDDFGRVYGTLYAFRPLEVESASEIIFDMVIALLRIFFVLCFASWVVFTTLLKFDRTARLQMKTDHALSYLRRHKVPANVQVQVLYGLYEAGDAKEMQNDFTYLMESNLPTELQRTITSQLWTPKLVSLGLIRVASSWHLQLVEELAMVCFEEVFASGSALFREGDVSFSAYLVLSGELQIRSVVRTLCNRDYKAGMWLGENALVNPTYRRGFSAYAMSLVSVMNVSSEAFRKVLEQLAVDKLFEEWCTKELWRGLCGRCGGVGDHFADECVGMMCKMSDPQSMGSRRSMDEVREYLRREKIEPLFPFLEELGISDLETLKQLDVNTLRERAETELGHLARPFSEVRSLLSSSRIERFKLCRQKSIKTVLQSQTKDHMIFISHYKVEAGTEAALLRSELQKELNAQHGGRSLAAPVFLDSDNLATLKEIQDRVGKSSNVVLLLTTGVLTRPWVLVEVVTAHHLGINVQLLDIIKPGNSFCFPDKHYYEKLVSGQIMDQDSLAVLAECNIDIREVELCLREIFKSISMPYSPHRPDTIRKAEIKALLGRCNLHVAPEQARGAWVSRQRRPSRTFVQQPS